MHKCTIGQTAGPKYVIRSMKNRNGSGRWILIELKRAGIKDTYTIWKLQRDAFADLFAKYQDYETSPGNETIEKIEARLKQADTFFYFMVENDKIVGAIRVVDTKDGRRKRISPIFVLKEYRNKGYAQSAMREAEHIHGNDNWELATILQETVNCYLYEKMGYHKTGQIESIHDKMTIIHYEKS